MFFFDLARFHIFRNSHVKLVFLFGTSGTTFRMSSLFSVVVLMLGVVCGTAGVVEVFASRWACWQSPRGERLNGPTIPRLVWWPQTHTTLLTFTQSQFYQIMSLQQFPRKSSISDQTDHKIGSKLCHISFMKKLFRSENKETIFISSINKQNSEGLLAYKFYGCHGDVFMCLCLLHMTSEEPGVYD